MSLKSNKGGSDNSLEVESVIFFIWFIAVLFCGSSFVIPELLARG